MAEIYLASIEKTISLFILLCAGFVIGKLKILPDGSNKTLSILQTKLFLPALIFSNLSANFRMEKISKYLNFFLVGAAFLVFSLLIAFVLSLLFDRQSKGRKYYTYVFAFSNYAYFGYPVIEKILGVQSLSYMIIFALPFTVTIYTLGVYLLKEQHGEKKRQSLKSTLKSIFTPVLISVILGVAFGLLNINLPNALSDGVSAAASCMGPISMLLTGLVLSQFRFKELFKSANAYIVSLVRLVFLPALVGGILWFTGVRGYYFILPTVMAAMPVGMNLILFPEADGLDSKNSGRICFISYLLAFFTIPLLFVAVLSLT